MVGVTVGVMLRIRVRVMVGVMVRIWIWVRVVVGVTVGVMVRIWVRAVVGVMLRIRVRVKFRVRVCTGTRVELRLNLRATPHFALQKSVLAVLYSSEGSVMEVRHPSPPALGTMTPQWLSAEGTFGVVPVPIPLLAVTTPPRPPAAAPLCPGHRHPQQPGLQHLRPLLPQGDTPRLTLITPCPPPRPKRNTPHPTFHPVSRPVSP